MIATTIETAATRAETLMAIIAMVRTATVDLIETGTETETETDLVCEIHETRANHAVSIMICLCGPNLNRRMHKV
jgi:hypothetical protein